MGLVELQKERALLDKEIAELSKHISLLAGSRTHRSLRFEMKVVRCNLTGKRQALKQRIYKLQTEQELLAMVNSCDLNDEEKARFLKTLQELQKVKIS